MQGRDSESVCLVQTSIFGVAQRRLCGQRRGAQNEQGVARAGNDCVGVARVVAEFDKDGRFVNRLDDSADLAAHEAVLG
jgi:hypothetical protein